MEIRLDRRAALRLGGGVIALAVGIGAGILDRRRPSLDSPGAGMGEPPGPEASQAAPSPVPTSPAPPDSAANSASAASTPNNQSDHSDRPTPDDRAAESDHPMPDDRPAQSDDRPAQSDDRPAQSDQSDQPEPQPEPEPVAPGVVAAGVIAVGEAYLRAVPEEADLAALLAALPAPDGDVVAAARRYVKADFESGRIVAVDGWMLARSEARAAAALALIRSAEG